MVKKSLQWVLRAALWFFGTLLVILVIVAAAVHFLLMPNINAYKDDIAALASRSVQQKVAIGHIEADWQGINPHFTVTGINVFDAQNRPALQLDHTEVSLSWLSIPKLEPHLDALAIREPSLTIRRTANGEIFVAGISTRGESKPDAMNWLLRQSQLSVMDAQVLWLDEMRQAPPLSLEHLHLDIVSPPWKRLLKNHEIQVSALPSVGTQYPVTIKGNVYGNDISKLAEWHGKLDIVLRSADLAAFKPWLDYPLAIQQGAASTISRVQFAESRITSLESNIKAVNLAFKLQGEVELQQIQSLSGQLNWQDLDPERTVKSAAYSIKLDRFQVVADKGLNLHDVTASYSQSKDARKSLKLKLPELDLQALRPYLLQAKLSEDLKAQLNGIAPEGLLHELNLQWQTQPGKPASYVFNTRFENLTAQAYEKLPGFDHLSGQVKANQRNGLLTLDSKDAQLDFKDILRWPVPISKMQGQVQWAIADPGTEQQQIEIEVKQLAISNPHVGGVLNATYLMDGHKGGHLDLDGKFDHGNAQYAPFYYPIMLGEETLHWLDTSIKQGRAEDIHLTVKGRLADFPFTDKRHHVDPKIGLFKVTAKVSDAVLEYGSDWPHIEGLGLDLLFEGKRMELNANTGHIFGTQIVKSRATIEQLDADNPILEIVSEAKGPVLEGLRFVNNSPVLELTQGFTETLKTSGSGKLNLALKIPLNDIEAANYKGVYAIANGAMESEAIPSLSRLNGVLEFTETGFSTKNIRAMAYGSPVVFNVQSGKDNAVRIAARGRLNDEAIRNVTGKASAYLSGTADWAADVLIQRPKLSIGIRSDLFGLTSTLPAPFGKEANERIGLRIDKRQDETTDVTTAVLGSRLGARIVSALADGELRPYRGVVNLNDRGPASGFNAYNEFNNLGRAPQGIQLYGSLSYLNADAWRKVSTEMKAAGSSTGGGGNAFNVSLGKTDLKIDALDVFDRRINQLRLQNKTATDNLQFNIQSREITGDVEWANQDNGRLIARLSNLTIPEPATKAKTPTAKEPVKYFQKLDQDYPALDITASNFEFGKKQFGGLELVAFPLQDDWIIKKLKLFSPDGTLNAEGEWNNWTRNPNTRLNVNWDIQDLGNTLKRLGYPDAINGGQGELKGQLNWAGSPHEFDTLSLNGNLQFDVRKGQVLQVKPGVGRLFGLLSLQSLPRRLNLDFRDLFNSGFAFDKITATVLIDRGILRSDNFMMAGPAADVTIKGETNLRTETQQLHVRVVPNISDSVSLAALAGGPLAGAVAFLAQKVLKDPLNKIVSTEYDIVGTWDDPRETKSAETPASSKSPLN